MCMQAGVHEWLYGCLWVHVLFRSRAWLCSSQSLMPLHNVLAAFQPKQEQVYLACGPAKGLCCSQV